MSKRKRTIAAPAPAHVLSSSLQGAKLISSSAITSDLLATKEHNVVDHCFEILDGEIAARASPDSPLTTPPVSERSSLSEVEVDNDGEDYFEPEERESQFDEEEEIATIAKKKRKKAGAAATAAGVKKQTKQAKKDRELVEGGEEEFQDVKPKLKRKATAKKLVDAEGREEGAVMRPPPVNSDYVPIPWKGRLGYACLNTYLRNSNPPIFCSRTCRIETILKHGDEGQKYVESLGLANAKDLTKLIEWNEKYGIKFLRISSEMFPFASHANYGYTLEFAKEALAEAGRAALKYGHRLSMHPGQFTQLGSPRKEVVTASVRDLEYHCQLLKFLGLKGQADKDAVLILHMGGVFGDREATLNRFRDNYTSLLSDEIKARLVLENDDMSWSVHELLPICKELNIPLVLDWHHHNIIHSPEMREGTLDILKLMPEIKETWTRKGITQKQHYSEPKYPHGSNNERRRHSPRVVALPPCENTMDLMIEAKDKEQAVFELMRIFKLPGWDKFSEVVPHVRDDENKPEPKTKKAIAPKKKVTKKRGKKGAVAAAADREEGIPVEAEDDAPKVKEPPEGPSALIIPEEEVSMGGPRRRVYWPEGMEAWLTPAKKIRKKKEETVNGGVEEQANVEEAVDDGNKKPTKRKAKPDVRKTKNTEKVIREEELIEEEVVPTPKGTRGRRKKMKVEEIEPVNLPVLEEVSKPTNGRRSKRVKKEVDYADGG